MPYQVLLFDDRPQMRVSLTEILEAEGMIVISCKNVFEAVEAWENLHNEIDALVLDMMMPSRGLSRTYLNSLDGEKNTGWAWLWHRLNEDHHDPHPAAEKCIIIFSAYLEEFREYLKRLDPKSPEAIFAAGLHLIGKNDENNTEEIISVLRKDRDATV